MPQPLDPYQFRVFSSKIVSKNSQLLSAFDQIDGRVADCQTIRIGLSTWAAQTVLSLYRDFLQHMVGRMAGWC